MKRLYLILLLSCSTVALQAVDQTSTSTEELVELPLSKSQKLAKKYTKKIEQAKKLQKPPKRVAPLASELPLSRYQALVKEYHEIYRLLMPHGHAAAMFALVHTKPLLKKQGIRRHYSRAIKAFEEQPFFNVLPQELKERIEDFDERAVKIRPRMARKHKVAIILSSLAAAGLVGAGAYALVTRRSEESDAPQQPLRLRGSADFMVDGKIDIEKIMPELEPEKINRFKAKNDPKAFTWSSFDQEKMGRIWNDMPMIVQNLLEQSFEDAKLVKVGANVDTDPAAIRITRRLLAVGRICLYLEQVDRGYLKKILTDKKVFNALLKALQRCPISTAIFAKLCAEFGLKKSKHFGTIESAFNILSSPWTPNPLYAVSLLLPSALPDGAAPSIKNNVPGTWEEGAKPYQIPPPHE